MGNSKLIALIIIVATSLFACNNDDNTNGTKGKLSIQLTDAPFPTDIVEKANVTINKIEIRKSGETEGDKFTILSEEEKTFNLLDLTNGITASLVDLEIETGSYDLIRLYVTTASIKIKNIEQEFELKIPSGSQTGIKIFIDPSLEVKGGLTSELLLDFVVSKSFILQGNTNSPAGIKGFSFKPVIKASNLSTTGRLTGNVYDAEDAAIEGAQVSIIAADTVYTTSFTDENGEYALLGVDAGTYKVTYEKAGFELVTEEEVEIAAANATEKNIQLTAVATTEETTTEE